MPSVIVTSHTALLGDNWTDSLYFSVNWTDSLYFSVNWTDSLFFSVNMTSENFVNIDITSVNSLVSVVMTSDNVPLNVNVTSFNVIR